MGSDLGFRVARFIDRVTRARDHCWTWHPGRCWHCDRRTWWLEMNFEAPLHRGRCTDAKDAEYFEALARPCGGCGGRAICDYCRGRTP